MAGQDGIFSLLDTDLYKLTMQCAVLAHFKDVPVSYKFTNRTPHMKLNRGAVNWLQEQIDNLGNLQVTSEELAWLEKTCPYLTKDYLTFLKTFKLRPSKQVKLEFAPDSADTGDHVVGDVSLSIHGVWVETILYEIPLLALTSEAYFRFIDRDWTYDNQTESAKQKGLDLLENGCVFSEFGSRRRRDYKTHRMVVDGLLQAQKEAGSNGKGWTGKFTGTSNVHMAMKFGVTPIGTVAHEWFMGIAAITDDYASANERAMQYWVATYGRGVLGIALTDTFGTPAFLKAFARPAPPSGSTKPESENTESYAQVFTGVRQDSGDPLRFVDLLRQFYANQGIKDKKVIVFSDSLNVERCIQYKKATDEAGLTPSFGVGTFFTNDFKRTNTGEKSVPLNIVIKIAEASGRPAVKLSDDVGKNMGEDSLVKRIKEEVGYTDRAWAEEAHRWDK